MEFIVNGWKLNPDFIDLDSDFKMFLGVTFAIYTADSTSVTPSGRWVTSALLEANIITGKDLLGGNLTEK